MESIKTINNRLTDLKQRLDTVKGSECDVYTRIVGYYRNVKNWNAGKSAEHKVRNNFIFENND